MAQRQNELIKIDSLASLSGCWSGAQALVPMFASAGLLIVITLAAYLPVIEAGFVFDDEIYVTDDNRLQSLEGLAEIWLPRWSTDYQHQYYPLTSSAFWIQFQIWRLNPLGYHLTNVFLHAVKAILLWCVLRSIGARGAWLAGAIFAVHPAHVMSVAWVTELKNVLSTLFFLSSALALIHFFQIGKKNQISHQGLQTNRKWHWYTLGLVLFVCALLSKTATALLPLALALLLYWKRDEWKHRDLLLFPMLVIGAIFVGITVYLESSYGLGNPSEFSETWLERCLIAGRAIWFFTGKLVWPDPLIVIYPRWQIDVRDKNQYLYPLAVLVVVGLIWAYRRRIGKGPVVAVAYFILAIVPMYIIDVAFTRFSFVSDHWQYWASMGLIALTASVLVHWWPAGRVLARVGALIALTVLSALTWQQSRIYRNQETLWRDTVEKNDMSYVAHYNLGNILFGQRKFDEAMVHFNRTLELDSDNYRAMNNMGNCLQEKKQNDGAIDYYRQAIRTQSNNATACANLGRILNKERRFEEAVEVFQLAIRADSKMILAHNGRGVSLAALSRHEEAIQSFNKVLEINSESLDAINNRGSSLYALGRIDEAIAQFRLVLDLQPKHARGHYNFGKVLAATGQIGAALTHFQEAMKIKSDWWAPLKQQAWILATHPDERWRHGEEALRLAKQAVDLVDRHDPGRLLVFVGVRDTLAAAYAENGQFDQAMAFIEEAITLAVELNNQEMASELRTRLEYYRKQQPYRELGRQP